MISVIGRERVVGQLIVMSVMGRGSGRTIDSD